MVENLLSEITLCIEIDCDELPKLRNKEDCARNSLDIMEHFLNTLFSFIFQYWRANLRLFSNLKSLVKISANFGAKIQSDASFQKSISVVPFFRFLGFTTLVLGG